MDELHSLKIDRSKKIAADDSGPRWAKVWIVTGIALLVLLGAARLVYGYINAAKEVQVVRVKAADTGSAPGSTVILNATGYIIAAHKIQVASKVLGRVAWIGVEKGDKVTQGQVIVRLEDDEYRAQYQQAKGNLEALQARLTELQNGSRPEEVAKSKADVEQADADLANAKINLERIRVLVKEGVSAKQQLDDAVSRYDQAQARLNSLQRTFDLVKIGPRREQIDAVKGQIEQAKGVLGYAQTQLDNTVIRAPVTGTILERAVEKGEFVTTSFVGDRGAKGYVVSLADLNDLQVELDISQNDFAKLGPKQKGVITTDAYPDRKYEGAIYEISPEANRQKATVQVKVKVNTPDGFLRPEMNANVAFVSETRPESVSAAPQRAVVYVPPSAVKDNSVFIIVQGKAMKRSVKTSGLSAQGLRVDEGLIGGEDLVVNAPSDLKDGDKVKART